MTDIPSVRQEQIMKWLHEYQTLTIDDLVARLGVSVMTVHRDLDALARAGVAQKVHGGVTLADSRTVSSPPVQVCKLCDMVVPSRTTFLIQTARGEQLYTCCPHCGLLLLNETKAVSAVLAKDFLYGRMINAGQAVYLLGCDVAPCCMPAALCFASREDVVRFQQGFGGQVMTFSEAQTYLAGHHRHPN